MSPASYQQLVHPTHAPCRPRIVRQNTNLTAASPLRNLRNLQDPDVNKASTKYVYRTAANASYRSCEWVTSPPLTPSKARAGGWEDRPVFTAPWTRLDDPASLRPLDCDSSATAELVTGALLDYTGTTTRGDISGQIIPYILNTSFLVPSILLRFTFFFRSCLVLVRTPALGARRVKTGRDPRGCSRSNPLLTFVNLSQTPSPTSEVDRATPTSNMGLTHVADAYATPPPTPRTCCGA